MVPQVPVLLLLTSAFSSISTDEINNHNTILVGKPGQEVKIKLDYLKLDDLSTLMREMARNYPTIVKKITLPFEKSANKLPSWALQISRNVKEKRKTLKPMVKFVANIHGDDVVGYALMVALMQYLVYMDGVEDRVSNLLNNTDIWIVPTMNPVGFSKSTAENGKGVDLDQDFPDAVFQTKKHYQHETLSMVKFILDNPFVLSGNLQSGAVVASYPLDYPGLYSSATDEEVFMQLAKDYAGRNPMMKSRNPVAKTFPEGIVSGTYFNKTRGSMQDANYILSNCFEITLYVCSVKRLPRVGLYYYWEANLESMLNFMENTRKGIFGLIRDKNGNPVKDAEIQVMGKEKTISGTEKGEYWRLLVPGNYAVKASGPGWLPQEKIVRVTKDEPYVQLDFILSRQGVYGHVWDEEGYPVGAAHVQVNEKSYAWANSDGEFGLTLSEGKYYVTASARGYKGMTVPVDITKNTSSAQVEFVLSPRLKSKLSKVFLGSCLPSV